MNLINTNIVNQFYPSIPSWLMEIISQPVLLLLAFMFGYFLFIKYKRKIQSGDFQLSNRQGMLISIIGVGIIVAIAHKFLGV